MDELTMEEQFEYEKLINITEEERALVEEEDPIPGGPGSYKGPKRSLWEIIKDFEAEKN